MITTGTRITWNYGGQTGTVLSVVGTTARISLDGWTNEENVHISELEIV